MIETIAELRECPFCGGGAAFEHLETGRWSVGCTDADGDCLDFQSLTTFARQCEAAAAWNVRPLEASQAARIEALEACLRLWAQSYIMSDTDMNDAWVATSAEVPIDTIGKRHGGDVQMAASRTRTLLSQGANPNA